MPYSLYNESENNNDKDVSSNSEDNKIGTTTKVVPNIMKLDNTNNEDDNTSINNQLNSDIPIIHSDIIKDNVFIGNMSFESIMECIEEQFNDYINLEDKNNYIDIFYNQLHSSYLYANSGIETFEEDMNNILDDIHNKFIYKIKELFNTRFTLTINDIESESFNIDEISYIIRRLYEFFILGARSNFKVVIANDIKSRIPNNIEDPKEYFKTLRNLMNIYSPLITVFGPMEFLKYKGDEEIIEFFNDGKVTGNFLRKYSPKLYQNEEFEVELINYITMVRQIKEEFNNVG